MISLRERNIYREILLTPYATGLANQLKIVSGYASPTMLGTHLADIQASTNSEPFSIEIVVGMSGGTSLSSQTISAFLGQAIESPEFSSSISVPKGQVNVHSKIYVWYRNDKPLAAWAGSANYTRLAFGLSVDSDNRDEVMFPVDPYQAKAYVEKVLSQSVPLSDGVTRATTAEKPEIATGQHAPVFDLPEKLDRQRFSICPLVNRKTGKIHNPGAGLNWGQPTARRSRKDCLAAYIPIPSNQRQIFPEIGTPFEAIYKDGQVLVLARAQQGGKALSMPSSNEGLGLFFRAILEVDGNRALTTEDLNAFGSDCVVFEKLTSEQYVLHFYPGLKADALEPRVF